MATDQMMQQAVLEQAADSGRATDTTLAHLTLGEVVIPREMMEDPEVMQTVQAIFEAFGANLAEFTVGDPANKINPETGYPEFFLGNIFKKIKKVFKKIAPIALPILGTMIPGVGPVLGGAIGGALGGAASGNGVKGILSGAALGGAGGYLTGGANSILGNAAGTTLDKVSGIAGMQGPTVGSGIKGVLSGGGLSALGSGGATGGLGSVSSFVKPAASIYSGMQQDEAIDEAERALLASQGKAERVLNPYQQQGLQAQTQLTNNLSEGFNPGDLTSDPGYQFRLNQGNEALNRSLAAQGMGQSGAALKAAQEYGQGMAATEYGNAYDRWLQQNQQLAGVGGQGANVAGALGGIYSNTGNVQSDALLVGADRKAKTLQEILAGLGY